MIFCILGILGVEVSGMGHGVREAGSGTVCQTGTRSCSVFGCGMKESSGCHLMILQSNSLILIWFISVLMTGCQSRLFTVKNLGERFLQEDAGGLVTMLGVVQTISVSIFFFETRLTSSKTINICKD